MKLPTRAGLWAFRAFGIPLLAFSIVAGIVVIGCSNTGQNQEVPQSAKPAKPRIVQPDTQDGKVFYFPVTGDNYRVSLAAWLKLLQKADPDLQCRYFGADYTVIYEGGYQGSHSVLVGHTIVCTSTAQNAQEETIP